MNLIIKQIQTKLKDHKLYQGAIDGIAGKLTLNAVEKAIELGICNAQDLYECKNPLITEHFRLSELVHSNTAKRLGLSNKPNAQHEANLKQAVINLWQPARDILKKPILINSGYRSPEVNRAVGGSRTSAHSIGFAIDFVSPSFGSTRMIADKLSKEFKANGIKFDQLILEFPDSLSSWVHLGYKNTQGHQRQQLLTAKKVHGRTQYFNGLL